MRSSNGTTVASVYYPDAFQFRSGLRGPVSRGGRVALGFQSREWWMQMPQIRIIPG